MGRGNRSSIFNSESKKKGRGISKAIGVLLGFALASAVIANTSRRFLEATGRSADGTTDRINGKLRDFAARKDDYNAVFLGSSPVFRGINPVLFDSELARRHLNFHSYNLGVPGMSWVETQFVLDFLRQQKPSRLKYIFVQANTNVGIFEENLTSERVVELHDWHYTSLAIRGIVDSNLKTLKKAEFLQLHARSFLYRITGTASLLRLYRAWLRSDSNSKSFVPDQGFISLDDETDPDVRDRREIFRNHRSQWQDALEKERRLSRPPTLPIGEQELPRSALSKLNQLADQVRKMGAVPVILVTPVLGDPIGRAARWGLLDSLDCPVISFADPTKYGDLFELDIRWDHNHLTKRGAALYTRELAQRFANEVVFKRSR